MWEKFEDVIRNYKQDLHKFQQEWLCKFVVVTSSDGRNCPEQATKYIEINSRKISLCDRCYDNYMNGAYDRVGFKIRNNCNIELKSNRMYLL